MINYQEQRQLEDEMNLAQNHTIAKVGAVYSDGLSLIFAGQSAASQKHYPCNNDVTFTAGNKVLLIKASGTYVAVCNLK